MLSAVRLAAASRQCNVSRAQRFGALFDASNAAR
jgi:hypothetical protein